MLWLYIRIKIFERDPTGRAFRYNLLPLSRQGVREVKGFPLQSLTRGLSIVRNINFEK